MPRRDSIEIRLERLRSLCRQEHRVTTPNVRIMMADVTAIFRQLSLSHGVQPNKIQALTTKFRDAGRRSPPWKPASSVVPGRPQDGDDGNRRPRWNFDPTHKFYAHENDATLTEVKYYLQALSMNGAPELPAGSIEQSFNWLIEHPVKPGNYLDPIQLTPIIFQEVLADARCIESGHLIPLDRGGRHEPKNAFLMLSRSNQLQGNLTLIELLQLMESIVNKHRNLGHALERAQRIVEAENS